MTTLLTSATGEVSLTLRGSTENRVLTTLRRWPHWNRHEIEIDPTNAERYLSITLITDQAHESTLREILQRSFGMIFPVGGGSSDLAPEPPVREQRRRW
ncbi:MAG: hypothetical protein HC828_14835 [Blastochloris sp.]|nr:hypothetical protein [Blastochloris sp.]